MVTSEPRRRVEAPASGNARMRSQWDHESAPEEPAQRDALVITFVFRFPAVSSPAQTMLRCY